MRNFLHFFQAILNPIGAFGFALLLLVSCNQNIDEQTAERDLYILHVGSGHQLASGEEVVDVTFDLPGDRSTLLLSSAGPVIWRVTSDEQIDPEQIYVGGDGATESKVRINGVESEQVSFLIDSPNANAASINAFTETILETLPNLGFEKPSGYYRASLAASEPILLSALKQDEKNQEQLWDSILRENRRAEQAQADALSVAKSDLETIRSWQTSLNSSEWSKLVTSSSTDEPCIAQAVEHLRRHPTTSDTEIVLLELGFLEGSSVNRRQANILAMGLSQAGAVRYFTVIERDSCHIASLLDLQIYSQTDLLFGEVVMTSIEASVPFLEQVEVWVSQTGDLALYKSSAPQPLQAEVRRSVDSNCPLSSLIEWADVFNELGCVRIAQTVVLKEHRETLVLIDRGINWTEAFMHEDPEASGKLSLNFLISEDGRVVAKRRGLSIHSAIADLDSPAQIDQIAKISPIQIG